MDKNTYRKFLMAKIDVAQREIEVTKELVAILDSESAPQSAAVEVVSEAPKAEKKSKAKTEKVQEVKPEVEVEVSQATESLDDDFMGEDEEISAPTLDDVRKVIKAFAAKHGKQKTEKLLAKFGATAIPQIKEKDFSKVLELANKYL